MNILYVAAESSISGANKSMCILIENVRKKNNDVCVVLPGKGDIEKELKVRKIKYYIVNSKTWTVNINNDNFKTFLKCIAKKVYNLKAIKRIQMIIKENKIDIVHNNSISSYVGAIAGYREKCKVIWHIREFLEEDHGIKINRVFKHKKIINSANKIITISQCVYDKYEKIYNKDKMVLIYNGISVDEFSNQKDILKSDKIKLAVIGRISEGKGQKDLVDAIGLLKKEYQKRIEVYLVGYNESLYALKLKEQINSEKLEKIIHFSGIIYDIAKFYKDIDIIVVNSRNEAFGRTTVEAMLESCLVIGANTGGTKELTLNGKYGLLYEKGKANSLAEKIIWAIDNKKEANSIVKEAYQYANNNFTSLMNANNIMKIYEEVM